jgi:dipeptidyl aminopeptidase/acylaminoacyl peptidase
MNKIVAGSVLSLLTSLAFSQVKPTAGEAVAGSAVIPRAALFGNPDKAQARISPDGKHISYIAPVNGVLNVFVGPRSDPSAAKAVTNDTKRGIRQHFWAYDNQHVLYLQDEGGDENWHVYSVSIAGGAAKDLTQYPKVQAQMVGVSWKKPGSVAIALNDRDAEYHDLYEVNLATGKRTLLEQNTQKFGEYEVDLDYLPKLALKNDADGGEIFRKSAGKWVSLLEFGQADTQTTSPVTVEGNGTSALILSSVGRDTSALVRIDIASGKQSVLGASEQADIGGIWLDPKTFAPQAYTVNYLKPEIAVLNPAMKKDVAVLSKEIGDGFVVTNRSLDNNLWTVVSNDAQAAATAYLYDRAAGSVTKLFDQRPALAKAPLVPMQSLEIKARDGLTLVSYLSLPPGSDANGDGRPDGPVPMVLNVHGGPWARDGYGFNSEHQWLANRGYAVLSVNYRGSTGFGKNFTNAGNKEWAAKMHDDLLDAVKWAVDEKVTTADKVAIYGGSYGGYATLVGVTFTPDTFACGVDLVGPSNLQTLFAKIPPYWKSFFEDLAMRVGDPRTEEGRKLLDSRSPLTRVDAIKKPLLVAQGANDPRVNKAEADQIVKAMKDKNIPVTYLLYPDEGHGFARPPNRTSFYAVAEGFLSQCLGGRYQPVGDDFKGSSIQVLEGAKYVPGLEAALK